MDADAILAGPRLKVQRANGHIDQLRHYTAPLHRGFYEIAVEANLPPGHTEPTAYRLVYRPRHPIPESLALIMGDALHNLRGALDYLATAIARTVDPKAQIHFPMDKSRKHLVNPRTKTFFNAIEKALPNSERLILDEIRPENAANESLWSFHVLNNNDKHNLLIPTVAVTNVANIHMRSGRTTLVDCGVRTDATREFQLVVSADPITIQQDFNTTVDVSFGKGGPFEDEPVVPTLVQISDLVTETLDSFERHIRANP